jgi:hypothetical protein
MPAGRWLYVIKGPEKEHLNQGAKEHLFTFKNSLQDDRFD